MIQEILDERKKTHGDYANHAYITQELKGVMRATGIKWNELKDMEKEALEMIVHKIGRILSGNPHYKDHWDDIAGYATLVAQRCCPDAGMSQPTDKEVIDGKGTDPVSASSEWKTLSHPI
jgi:hypothetical protein